MKQREAKELHIKQLNIDLKIRKELQLFDSNIERLGRKVVNDMMIKYSVREGIYYYIPLIKDLYILYNYGPSVADRFCRHSIIAKRRRYKMHKYA